MSLSDRERAEGFHRPPFPAVASPVSERAEGFHRPPFPAVASPVSERAEGFHRLLSTVVALVPVSSTDTRIEITDTLAPAPDHYPDPVGPQFATA
jgi:hypothetical protein